MRRIEYKEGEIIASGISYVREFSNIGTDGRRVLLKCHCGNEFNTRLRNVTAIKTQSCGCTSVSNAALKNIKHGDSKQGQRHYLYSAYKGMIGRCYNPQHKSFKYYGSLGISVYDVWKENYIYFKNDILSLLGEKPTSQHSLDRIDNFKGYFPENMRWATKQEQLMNRSTSPLTKEDVLEISWLLSLEILKQKDIAIEYNVSPTTVHEIKVGRKYNSITNNRVAA